VPLISIITVTHESAGHLPKLIDSLLNQTDKDFEWVIADGVSTDGTLEILEKISKKLNIVISSQPDFGIYDAMNRAIKLSTGTYYIVAGSDDYFYPNMIENFKREITITSADMIVAGVDTERGEIKIFEGRSWLYGARAYITTHSVGTLIRRSLHDKFGYYSNKFAITADNLFIKQICQASIKRHIAPFKAGFFSINGVSNKRVIHTLLEGLHIQLLTEKHQYFQILIFFIRIFKHRKKLKYM